MKKIYNTPEIELMKLTSMTATCTNESFPFGGDYEDEDFIED